MIRSPRNRRVAETARLRRREERRATGLTLVEGPHLLEEAVAADVVIHTVFGLEEDHAASRLAERAGAEWVPVDPVVLDRLAPTVSPRGPVAVMRVPPPRALRRDVVVLEVGDPGNAGTLIRTAAAFAQDVAVADPAVDVWSPKVLRAGAGAHFRTSIGPWNPSGMGTIATVARGGLTSDRLGDHLDPARRWAVLVGPESRGLPAEEVAAADLAVTIPMPGGTESLNAAIAGTLVAYELMRWREAAGAPG